MGILEDIARRQATGYIADSQSILPKQPDSRPLLELTDDEIDARFAAIETSQVAPKPTGERTFLGTLGDIGVSAAKGVVGAGEAAVGLANIPTLGRAGKFLEENVGYDSETTQEYLSSLYSTAQQAANRQVSEAKGFLPTVGTALQNPSTIVHSVIESIPSMIGGGMLGRGLIKTGAKIGPWAAGAIGEGAVAGGMVAEDVRQQSETGTITGSQAAKSVGAGIGTSIFGVVGNRLAKRLGVGDIDEWLAGGKLGPGTKTTKLATKTGKMTATSQKGVVNRIISGGITEGVFEELPQSMQEQVWMNAATDKPLMENVGESAALGMLAGAAMGGGFGIFTQPGVVDDKTKKPGDTAARPGQKPFDTGDQAAAEEHLTPEELAEIKAEETALQKKKAAIENKKEVVAESDMPAEEKQAAQAEISEEEAYWQAEEARFKNEIKVRKATNVLNTALQNDYVGTIQRLVNNPELLAELPAEVRDNFLGMLSEPIPTTDLVSKLLVQNQRALDSEAYMTDEPLEVVENEFAELSPEEQERVIKREQSVLALIKRQKEIAFQQPRKTLREIEADVALDRFANRIENHLPGFIEIAGQQQQEETLIIEGQPAPDQVIPIDYGEADPRQFDPFAKTTRRLGGKVFPRPQDISPEAVEGYDPSQPMPRIGTNYQHLQPIATSIRQRDEMLRNPLTMEIEAKNNNVDPETFRRQLIQDNIADRAALAEMARQADQNTPLTAGETQAANEAALMANQVQVRQLTDQLAAVNTKAEETEIQRQILSLLDEQKKLKAQLTSEIAPIQTEVPATETAAEPVVPVEPSRSIGEQQVGEDVTLETEETVTPDIPIEKPIKDTAAQIALNNAEIERLLESTAGMPAGKTKNDLRDQAQRLIVENQRLKAGQEAQFEVREEHAPGQGITLADIQATYPNQEVFQSEDGSFSVRFKNGRGVTIQKITDVGDGFIEVVMDTGEMSNKDGKIFGVTIGSNILLAKDFADNATLWHENKHVLDNMGLITQEDDNALNREFNKLRKAGQLTFVLSTNTDPDQAMRENRANTFAQVMLNRAEYRNKPLGTLIQRIMDFFNKLFSLGQQTVSGLAREVETGKIYERQVGDQTYSVRAPQMKSKALREGFPQFQARQELKPSNQKESLQKLRSTGADVALDNPQGNWLKEEQEKAERLADEGSTYFGSPTLTVRNLELQTSFVAGLPGLNDEHLRINKYDPRVTELKESIQENGFRDEEPIFINVRYDGQAYINEGNHRILAAQRAGMKNVPVEIVYFAGGEDFAGPMSVEQVAKFAKQKKPNEIPQFQIATQPATNVADLETPTRDIPQEEYDRIHAQQKSIWAKVRQVSRMTKADAKLFLDKLGGSISTRLKNISPLLSAKLRRLDFDTTTQISRQLQVALPIMRAVDKMSSADRSAWDWATKNGDINRINALADRYGIKENYTELRQVLDNIRKAAVDVGYDVGYIDNYWPRILKDQEGFLQATKEISQRPEFSDALKTKAKKLGISVKNMDKDLKADIIGNIILSNYGGIGGPGNIQGRVFDIIPEEFAPYYMDSGAALMQYIYSMNKKIEARRFFGRVPKNIGRAKTKVRTINTRLTNLQEMEALMTSEGQDTTDINNKINELQDEAKLHQAVIEKYKLNDRDFSENIDTYIVELLEKNIIAEDQETTVKEILNARFHEQGTHGIVNKYKNFAYIDTMGSPISALTQIGDLAWAYYVGGLSPTGIARTTKNLVKATFKKSGITKEDLGIERIAQEFADADTMSNAVSWVFKAVQLERIDSIGKETLINTSFENYKEKANNNPEALKKEIRHIFGKETNSVVQDLLANNPSDNVKLLVYNRLLDFQPVALSEMPEKYLNSGNGRIFYMLKTYTLKQIDVFRREVYQQLRSGDQQKVMSGMRNLIGLASVLTLANAGTDALKDLIMGKESKFEDHVIENLLTLGGASRYLQTQIRKDGAGSALFGQILPPFKFVDSVTRDVFGDTSDGLRVMDSVPIGGKLYYWHFGRGSEKRPTLNEQEFKKLRKKTDKFKNKFEEADDKRLFLQTNIDQFRQMKMVESMQSSLNKNKSLINKLKDMDQTPNVQKRIAQLKQRRELMLENFFQKTNMGD